MEQTHTLQYGNVAWGPYFRKDIKALERVQHRASLPEWCRDMLCSAMMETETNGLASLVYMRAGGMLSSSSLSV
jgi:hypothetical protein